MTLRITALSMLILFAAAFAADGLVSADLDGDGKSDTVRLEQAASGLSLSVSISSAGGATRSLRFGVNAARQDAVCRLPVQVGVEPLECAPDGQPLPGCKALPGAQELVLDDDTCDVILVYWNHEKRELGWWRL